MLYNEQQIPPKNL